MKPLRPLVGWALLLGPGISVYLLIIVYRGWQLALFAIGVSLLLSVLSIAGFFLIRSRAPEEPETNSDYPGKQYDMIQDRINDPEI